MTQHVLRAGFLALAAALLVSCGGGGGGGGGAFAPVASSGGNEAGAGSGPAAATNASGDAGGGLGGIAADDASASTSTTASGGEDGSGVGSGGTGVSTADATSVGAVDGAGSIIVSGLRYETDRTASNIQDAPAGLQLGMTARVTGPVSADFTRGVALRVDSAADLRGPLTSVDLQQGSFVVLGTRVTTDGATVWADASGLAGIQPGKTLQIWGLPGSAGVLRATRVEQHDQGPLILTGTVQGLDTVAQVFTLGGLVVDFSTAARTGGLDGQSLAVGTLVRVRASGVLQGRLAATSVERWYPLPRSDGTTVQIAGLVTQFAGPASLRVLGLEVDASTAQITGGPTGAIGNGVKVEVGGRMVNGILKATKLKLRHVPGTGGPASFDLIGTIGAFRSPADFRVKGQPINAAGAGVDYRNGSAANLGNGVKVHVHGAEVVNGVLTADRVEFQ